MKRIHFGQISSVTAPKGGIHMMTKPDWWQYATFDEDGFLTGIREDAPETAKAEYAEWKKDTEQGLKI